MFAVLLFCSIQKADADAEDAAGGGGTWVRISPCVIELLHLLFRFCRAEAPREDAEEDGERVSARL